MKPGLPVTTGRHCMTTRDVDWSAFKPTFATNWKTSTKARVSGLVHNKFTGFEVRVGVGGNYTGHQKPIAPHYFEAKNRQNKATTVGV